MAERFESTAASAFEIAVVGAGEWIGHDTVPAGRRALVLGDPGATAMVVFGTADELAAWHAAVGRQLGI